MRKKYGLLLPERKRTVLVMVNPLVTISFSGGQSHREDRESILWRKTEWVRRNKKTVSCPSGRCNHPLVPPPPSPPRLIVHTVATLYNFYYDTSSKEKSLIGTMKIVDRRVLHVKLYLPHSITLYFILTANKRKTKMGCCCSKESNEPLQSEEPLVSPGGSHNRNRGITITLPKQAPLKAETGWKVPPSAEAVQLHHVIDGDSFTLSDDRRVRMLGLDCPDYKERQPFAAEAKAKTEALIPKGCQMWIDTEFKTKTDPSGRLLCYVYVGTNEGNKDEATLVNYELLREGFAMFRSLPDSRLKHESALRGSSAQARQEGRGLWGRFMAKEGLVAIGKEYHLPTCKAVKAGLKDVKHMNVDERKALADGLAPCQHCLKPAKTVV